MVVAEPINVDCWDLNSELCQSGLCPPDCCGHRFVPDPYSVCGEFPCLSLVSLQSLASEDKHLYKEYNSTTYQRNGDFFEIHYDTGEGSVHGFLGVDDVCVLVSLPH